MACCFSDAPLEMTDAPLEMMDAPLDSNTRIKGWFFLKHMFVSNSRSVRATTISGPATVDACARSVSPQWLHLQSSYTAHARRILARGKLDRVHKRLRAPMRMSAVIHDDLDGRAGAKKNAHFARNCVCDFERLLKTVRIHEDSRHTRDGKWRFVFIPSYGEARCRSRFGHALPRGDFLPQFIDDFCAQYAAQSCKHAREGFALPRARHEKTQLAALCRRLIRHRAREALERILHTHRSGGTLLLARDRRRRRRRKRVNQEALHVVQHDFSFV
eukprot:6214770-Pleurochrysis_carterae.AAC.5